jgi:hypothetical protein
MPTARGAGHGLVRITPAARSSCATGETGRPWTVWSGKAAVLSKTWADPASETMATYALAGGHRAALHPGHPGVGSGPADLPRLLLPREQRHGGVHRPAPPRPAPDHAPPTGDDVCGPVGRRWPRRCRIRDPEPRGRRIRDSPRARPAGSGQPLFAHGVTPWASGGHGVTPWASRMRVTPHSQHRQAGGVALDEARLP